MKQMKHQKEIQKHICVEEGAEDNFRGFNYSDRLAIGMLSHGTNAGEMSLNPACNISSTHIEFRL